MDRFFLPVGDWEESRGLTGDEAHHCRRVMRKKVGDEVVVFDGEGREALATILGLSSSEVKLEVGEVRRAQEVVPQIEVGMGIPKGKTFDLVIQKAVELGVSKIFPLMTSQGNVRLDGKEAASKQKKWQRLALEACKQCGQNGLPRVEGARGLSEFLKEADGVRLVAALTDEAKALRWYLRGRERPEKVTILIGPEGDFSEKEYEEIFEAGFSAVDLGSLVLRTETAFFAMVAGIRYEFQG